MKRLFLVILLLIIAVGLIGCDQVYRSRIYVRTTHGSIDPPSAIVKEVESTVKEFSLQHRYSIIECDKNDPWIKQEIGEEKPLIIWIAKKDYETTILFTSAADTAVVRLIKLSGPFRPKTHKKYTDELYLLLKNRFGATNVELFEECPGVLPR
jgi:hypothetical protein